MSEVLSITNPMIRETALPNFRLAPDQGAERMGIPSFDQLERALDGHVVRRGSAVKLVDDLAGESPVSADYPVGAVVISGDGTGDQTVGSLDVNALEGWT